MSFPARCCAFVRGRIFAPASCREAHKRRFLSFIRIIRRSLEFFASAKNRDDFSFFVASPKDLLNEIATSRLSSLLEMTALNQ